MVTLPQYGYPHPKIEVACKDVTKPQFSGCARHMETYRDLDPLLPKFPAVMSMKVSATAALNMRCSPAHGHMCTRATARNGAVPKKLVLVLGTEPLVLIEMYPFGNAFLAMPTISSLVRKISRYMR